MKIIKPLITVLFFIGIIVVIYFIFRGKDDKIKIREVKGELFIPADSFGHI